MKQTCKEFLDSDSELVKVYCKFVAIENSLKSERPIFSHNVPLKIMNFGIRLTKQSVYTSHSSELREILKKFKVNGKPSVHLKTWQPCIMDAPHNCYPFIRYTRFKEDYPTNYTDRSVISDMNKLLDKIIATLKTDNAL